MTRNPVGGKNSRFTLLLSIAIIVAGLFFAREVLIPLALAVLFSFLLTPPVRWLEKIKIPRSLATIIVVLLSVAVVGGMGMLVGRQLASVISELPSYQDQLRTKLQSLGSHGGVIKKAENDMRAITADASAQKNAPVAQNGVPPAAPLPLIGAASSDSSTAARPTPDNPLPVREYPSPMSPMGMLRDYAYTVLSPLATAALVLVFVIFMLISREDLRDRVIRLLGHGRLNVTTQALDEASTRISSYLGALAIVNGCYGVSTAAGLWVIGKMLGHGHQFPDVLVWGLFVGLCRFIPYIGIFVGGGIPILLAFALFPGNGVMIATIILFAVLEIVVGQFIEPLWYGSSTGMSALAVLVAAVFWTWLWGAIGLLLSTPLTVILVVMGKYVPQLKFLDILLREESVLTPPYRFYQRLIALDQEEGAEMARDYLNEKKSLELAYDDLLLPALAMSENDLLHDRLSVEQLEFVRRSVRDISDELADQYRVIREEQAKQTEVKEDTEGLLSTAVSQVAAAASSVASVAANVANAVTRNSKSDEESSKPAKGHQPTAHMIEHFPKLPHGCEVKVLCLPARGDADEIVALLLGQLLESRGYCALTPTADVLASEMVEMVEKQKIDVVCVSAMPPAAVAHCRYLCKLLHASYPDITMLVGLWTLKGDMKKAQERISCSTETRIVINLHDAVQEVEQLAQPAILRASNERREDDANARKQKNDQALHPAVL